MPFAVGKDGHVYTPTDADRQKIDGLGPVLKPDAPNGTTTAGGATLYTVPSAIFADSVYVRLERLGFRVGQGLSERFSRDRPRFTDSLDVIKFLCKDLWMVVFKKQIDNLKTNHRVC